MCVSEVERGKGGKGESDMRDKENMAGIFETKKGEVVSFFYSLGKCKLLLLFLVVSLLTWFLPRFFSLSNSSLIHKLIYLLHESQFFKMCLVFFHMWTEMI